MSDKGHIDKLARKFVELAGLNAPPRMTGGTTPGGTDLETVRTGLPYPLGDVGDVPTVSMDGGDKVVTWEPPAGGSGGQYQMYVLISDGAGGFDFVDDGAGNPVTTIEDLE